MQRIGVLQGELDYLLPQKTSVENGGMKPEQRMRELGHPKELIEKIYTACSAVKQTYEELPKIVERMDQRRKTHEVCAQVMLGICEMESQQKAMIERFGENSSLMKQVREGMAENVEICKRNIEALK